MKNCERCGSYAINHHCHGRDGSDPDLCDVCYWRKRAERQPLMGERIEARMSKQPEALAKLKPWTANNMAYRPGGLPS
jgi:hypothetical protein